jgi:hypothetical protein
MDSELIDRIKRLYVTLARVAERDLRKFPPRVFADDRVFGFSQDFRGGATEPQLSEALHALINAVASFHDHLQNWAQQRGINRESVHKYFKESVDFCIVRDLWNNDKHGYPPRFGSWSKRDPRVYNIDRVCQLRTRPEKGSTVGLTLDRAGRPRGFGDGSVSIVITGDVVDDHGNSLGNAHDIIERSVRVCEAALHHFGVRTGSPAVRSTSDADRPSGSASF